MLTVWFLLEIVNCNVEQDARVDIPHYDFHNLRDESQTVPLRIINGLRIWQGGCGRIAR